MSPEYKWHDEFFIKIPDFSLKAEAIKTKYRLVRGVKRSLEQEPKYSFC
jgi:hypothetical protein